MTTTPAPPASGYIPVTPPPHRAGGQCPPFLATHPALATELVLGGVTAALLPILVHAGSVLGWALQAVIAAVMLYIPVRVYRRWAPHLPSLLPQVAEIWRVTRANVHTAGRDG